MFGLSLLELLVITILIILLVPPKDLPAFLNKIGYWMGRIRQMSHELQHELNEIKASAKEMVSQEEKGTSTSESDDEDKL